MATGTENLRYTSHSPITTANMGDRIPPPMPGQLPSSFDDNEEFFNERPMQKVVRKLKEEPLVPLGLPTSMRPKLLQLTRG
ncbi:Respiratory supercomplex factor 1, mitochondrial [Metarhizium acridum]|nr:Respiratory supercomplex factor 1, mitochondrial [Metarhizium acridum]